MAQTTVFYNSVRDIVFEVDKGGTPAQIRIHGSGFTLAGADAKILPGVGAYGMTQIDADLWDAIVKQYERLFAMDGVELQFDNDTLDYIVSKADEYKLGARGLRSIVETIMMDKMFEIPSAGVKSCRITKEYACKQVDKNLVAGAAKA